MNTLLRLNKNKAIKSYLVSLPKLMTIDYGKSREYTAMQVVKSIERYKFNTKYQKYALALYCSKEDFEQFCNENMIQSEYMNLRNELSLMYFDGSDFNGTDIAKYSVSFSGYNYIDPLNDEGDFGCVDGDGD